MAARKKPSRKAAPGKRNANPIDEALARLERDIPRILRQLRSNVREMQKQVDRARADGEKRWREAERKIKQDAGVLRTRLERAIGRVSGSARKVKARVAGRPKAPARAGKRPTAGHRRR